MARHDIVLTVDDVDRSDMRGKLCVIIDVLRASTTIAAALEAGSSAVIPAETPDEAREIVDRYGCLLGGERESVRIDGFDFGNSPLEYTAERIGGIRMIARVRMLRFLVSGFRTQRRPSTRNANTTRRHTTNAGVFTPSNPVHVQLAIVKSPY